MERDSGKNSYNKAGSRSQAIPVPYREPMIKIILISAKMVITKSLLLTKILGFSLISADNQIIRKYKSTRKKLNLDL